MTKEQETNRPIGAGTFSLGSAVKFGAISIKIDLNDMEKTLKMIKEAQALYTKLQNLQLMKQY